MKSRWPIVLGVLAVALGAVWYDAHNTSPSAGSGVSASAR